MLKQLATPLFIILLGINNMAQASTSTTGYKVGQQAPGFELKTLDGEIHSLDALKRKGYVLLVFWATECVYCYAHVADFKKLHKQYADKGLTLTAINIGGEYDIEVNEYVKDNQLNYLVLSDRLNNLDVAEAYHVIGTPTMVLVSPQGEIVYRGHEIPAIEKWIKL
ncbi:MAG: TlpA disulfide reductase family protein [Thioalkalispiraceae bacterium]|jgi:peroxiredoxin